MTATCFWRSPGSLQHNLLYPVEALNTFLQILEIAFQSSHSAFSGLSANKTDSVFVRTPQPRSPLYYLDGENSHCLNFWPASIGVFKLHHVGGKYPGTLQMGCSLDPQIISHLTVYFQFSSELPCMSFVYVIPWDLHYKVRGRENTFSVLQKLKLALSDCFIVMAMFIVFQIYFVLEFLL